MATYNSCDMLNTEIDCKDLNDFVADCVFPQCVCVTDGSYLSRGAQISSGDVLFLKTCDSGQVTLAYKDEASRRWTEVSVSLEYSQKFHVLLPKESPSNSKTVSVIMYPTIADLLLDCPTYFEVTSACDTPGPSVRAGDRFWFVGLVKYEDKTERLRVRDETNNFSLLSLECRGNFCPLQDEHEYTIRELVELAAVPRRLKMVSSRFIHKRREELSDNEYTSVVKSHRPQDSKSNMDQAQTVTPCLPASLTGVVHLLKYEKTVTVSPYNDLDTTWKIPVSANLKVRIYSQNDYEVPAPKNRLFQHRVPLPLAPTLSHKNGTPLVPLNIQNFVDMYGPTLPVKAQIVSSDASHPFLPYLVRNMENIIVYRLHEDTRLYAKDAKSDDVYSLSRDLKLSFIEYPETFKTVSELVHVPVGTEVTVLEDIAADFPKPLSLRFGDVIKLTSNTPKFVRIKNGGRDCQVLKCELVDKCGGKNACLKVPLDLEVSMVIAADPSSRRMISLQDLLAGTVPVPTQNVASVPEDSGTTLFKDVPVELRLLKCMKQHCLVIAPEKRIGMTSSSQVNTLSPATSLPSPPPEKSQSNWLACHNNIGLPLSSGIVLAFREQLDMFELDVQASEADYTRLPIEKLTLAQFEERDRSRKLQSDYEDIQFGSSSTLSEYKHSHLSKTASMGYQDKKQKSTKMDKVHRLSRALNPRHWRHSKAEPEPLPLPSAMGLMALAARPKEEIGNEYQSSSANLASASRDGSTTNISETTSQDVEENFYEDVEIGPIKSSTMTPGPVRQTGAFLGPAHRSLPHRISSNSFAASSRTRATHDSSVADSLSVALPTGTSPFPMYDVPKPLIKAKQWATNTGNNLGQNLSSSSKPQYDIPRNNETKTMHTKTESTNETEENRTSSKVKPPITESHKRLQEMKGSGESVPVAPARRKGKKLSSKLGELIQGPASDESILPGNQWTSSLDDSAVSNKDVSSLPTPKPRGQKQASNKSEQPQSASMSAPHHLQPPSTSPPPHLQPPSTSPPPHLQPPSTSPPPHVQPPSTSPPPHLQPPSMSAPAKSIQTSIKSAQVAKTTTQQTTTQQTTTQQTTTQQTTTQQTTTQQTTTQQTTTQQTTMNIIHSSVDVGTLPPSSSSSSSSLDDNRPQLPAKPKFVIHTTV